MTIQAEQQFEKLLEFLKFNRGFDFSGYKRASLTRRIDKRMQMIGINRYDEYIDFLAVHPEEYTALFNTILINVTSFFRDSTTWEFLESDVIPDILKNLKPDEMVRVWSVGCASGEETYSIAMLLAEVVGLENFINRVKIYATDLDEESLAKARSAVYSPRDVEEMPAEMLEKYFEKSNGGYLAHRELRRSVIFGKHDVINDAPISRIDLLLCRNLLMYFNTDTQSRVLARLHFSIKDGGYLVLGKAEMLLAYSSLFTPVDMKMRVFRAASKPSFRDRLQLMTVNNSEEGAKQLASQFQLREAGFNASPVAQVVVDNRGALALANDRARELFGLTPHDIGRPFQDLQLSYRPAELRSSIEAVYEGKSALAINGVNGSTVDGKPCTFDIHVSPLKVNGNGITGILISFVDTSVQVQLQERLEHANLELETAMGELQSSNEELETTNEELQSTIEELETTNEELQSSNEEMETMNEELQSTNEELETISEESRVRNEELFRVNRLLDAIVTSLRGGIIVTDDEMRVLVWNHKSEDLWGLRADEVIGRHLPGLDIGLPVDEVQSMIKSIINGQVGSADTVLQATNRRGRSIQCKISIIPLVILDQGIHGTILVAEDGA